MLVLKRIFQNEHHTIGKLYDGDTYLCDTLEPPKNVNHPCIDKGTYRIGYIYSNMFGAKDAVSVGSQRTHRYYDSSR